MNSRTDTGTIGVLVESHDPPMRANPQRLNLVALQSHSIPAESVERPNTRSVFVRGDTSSPLFTRSPPSSPHLSQCVIFPFSSEYRMNVLPSGSVYVCDAIVLHLPVIWLLCDAVLYGRIWGFPEGRYSLPRMPYPHSITSVKAAPCAFVPGAPVWAMAVG